MVPRVRPMPTRFLIRSLHASVDNTSLLVIPSVRYPGRSRMDKQSKGRNNSETRLCVDTIVEYEGLVYTNVPF